MREFANSLMREAMLLADQAGAAGDIPVGAIVCDGAGKIIGRGFNTREVAADPVGHAEINALRAAAKKLGGWNLAGCTLIVTLEPCTMCAGAIINSRIDRVIFGAWDEKAGAAGSLRDVLRDARLPHQVEVIGGVMHAQTANQLREWFGENLRS
ncbi:nucleoside deaminase [Arcanobacterium hippocoleae]|uniref:tRNA-specific adenosine deaminase n=1 Tax=Arcanobacterium hippocoleae TaxID=149017 RepID=A0ABU1T307_9ACTO|nr:nucleoside deaminase [Arcanobacterium hippocoleae]MDR6939641.1 tRNA(adenine34) deaminase [Arcanobacterium hippocoleae]